MTQEDKQLLLKDICARLPYGVIIQYHTDYDWAPVKMHNISAYGLFNDSYRIENCKPYLRPMGSMTEEESRELGELITIYDDVDWMLAHHFDVHNLIEKGLALEAKEGMYSM